jgi:hypothetical protein
VRRTRAAGSCSQHLVLAWRRSCDEARVRTGCGHRACRRCDRRGIRR